MPLRLLYYTLHDLALPSAPTSHVRATVQGLRARGHEVCLIGTTSDPAATRDLDPIDCGAFLHAGPLRRPGGAWRAVRRAAAIVRERAADAQLVYARHVTVGGIVPRGLPVVYEINGLLGEELRAGGSPLARVVAWRGERELRRTLGRARLVIAVSEGLRAATVATYGVPPARIRVIENGVDTTVIVPGGAAERARVRAQWGCPLDAPVVGIVGSFGRQRVEWLLEAWPRVRARFPDARILLLGPDATAHAVTAAVRDAGLQDCVVQQGPVPEADLTGVYAGLDLSLQLLASYAGVPQHGSSIKVRTGLAAGRPVIATDHPALSFLEEERIGSLVPEAEPVRLADTIIQWLSDPAHLHAAGARAREYAVRCLDWQAGLDTLEPLLHDVAAAHPDP